VVSTRHNVVTEGLSSAPSPLPILNFLLIGKFLCTSNKSAQDAWTIQYPPEDDLHQVCRPNLTSKPQIAPSLINKLINPSIQTRKLRSQSLLRNPRLHVLRGPKLATLDPRLREGTPTSSNTPTTAGSTPSTSQTRTQTGRRKKSLANSSKPTTPEFAINNGSQVNRVVLSRKHIFDAVERSVQRLGTCIDVLQTHRLDRDMPMEEIMKAFNDVIEGGSVRYIGGSSVR
jgi:hypothetical protein